MRNDALPTLQECSVRDSGLLLREVCATCRMLPRQGPHAFEPGSILALQGDRAENMFAVVEGLLKEAVTLDDGRAQAVRLVGPGGVTGTEALSDEPYLVTIATVAPSRVCLMPAGEVLSVLKDRPEQGLALSRALSGQLADLKRTLVRVGSMTAEERVEDALRQIASGFPANTWFRLPLSRQELADLLGLALGTVSREVQRLKRSGVLDVHGRRMRFISD